MFDFELLHDLLPGLTSTFEGDRAGGCEAQQAVEFARRWLAVDASGKTRSDNGRQSKFIRKTYHVAMSKAVKLTRWRFDVGVQPSPGWFVRDGLGPGSWV